MGVTSGDGWRAVSEQKFEHTVVVGPVCYYAVELDEWVCHDECAQSHVLPDSYYERRV